jgi:hypothetical protein
MIKVQENGAGKWGRKMGQENKNGRMGRRQEEQIGISELRNSGSQCYGTSTE